MAGRDERRRVPVIKDVAELAKVSVPTVSRYLNRTSPVSPEKAERIARASDLLGYRPSPIARVLVKESLKSVAILTTDTTLHGSVMTISGIEHAASRAGYLTTITALATTEAAGLPASIDLALDQNPAGVIVLKFDNLGEAAARVIPASTPTVLIAGQRDESRAQVSLREDEGGYAMTRPSRDGSPVGHRRVEPGRRLATRPAGGRGPGAGSAAGLLGPRIRPRDRSPTGGP